MILADNGGISSQLELEAQGEVYAKADFLTATQPLAGPSKGRGRGFDPRGMARSLASGSLAWALSKLGIGSSEGDEEDAGSGAQAWRQACKQRSWVCWENLRQAADAVLEEQYIQRSILSSVDLLYSRDAFRAEFGTKVLESFARDRSFAGGQLGEEDTELLLRHLQRDQETLIYDKEVSTASDYAPASPSAAHVRLSQVVKFSKRKGEMPPEITQQDKDLVHLKTTQAALEGQIEDIRERIEG